MTREMSVSGSFYPKSAKEIERYFEHFNKLLFQNIQLPDIKTKVIIVPHAGYVYSGFTANIAYRILKNSDIKNFLVIGPSHRIAFDGVSVCESDSYKTPFGDIKGAKVIGNDIRNKFGLKQVEQAHKEHSTEVQFPFIKHYISDASIVELVYSNVSSEYISEIIDYALSIDGLGIIISTDLSHFHTLEEANVVDNICLQAIKNLDMSELRSGCEACGIIGVEGVLKSAAKLGLKSNLLDYRTSADFSNDKDRVVGYLSACFV